MPRQSLGSQSSKLQIHGGSGTLNPEEKLLMSSISPTSESQASPSLTSSDYKFKTEKMFRSNSKTNKCIHLIPLLTLLCLLILYLCSHDPNPKGFDGMKIGTTDEIRRELKKAGRRIMGNA